MALYNFFGTAAVILLYIVAAWLFIGPWLKPPTKKD